MTAAPPARAAASAGPPAAERLPPLATGVVVALVALKLAIGLVVLAVTPYGVHRDEFLYFSMGGHLRLWRMDFPPLIAMLAELSRALFGESLAAARIPPSITGAVLVLVAALVARELGGGRFAQALAALCVVAGTLFLRAGILFQPVGLDQLWWTLASWMLVRAMRAAPDGAEATRAWLLFGAACGLGLLTKFSILFFGLAAFAALLALPEGRRALRTPWPWAAAALALVVGSPSIVGQLALGFPVRGQMAELQASQLGRVTYGAFVAEQPLLVGPAAWLLAVAGACALLGWRPLRAGRLAGLACVLAFAFLLVLHGKAYYAGPIYPTLFAAGAVLLERWRPRRAAIGPAVRWATPALVAAFGIVALPLALPILSPAATSDYAVRIGATPALRTNRGQMDRLPQDFADMLGWEAQARALAQVYRSLTPAEQREAVIIAGNYGEAGAAEFHGARWALPPVVSPAGSFWFFGPGPRPGNVAITIGIDSTDLAPFFGDVHEVARIRSAWSVHEERELTLYVARRPRAPLQAVWPSLAGNN